MDAKVALENLILARDVFNALGIRYFLTYGTLLGLVRDGKFIEWDADIDIGVFPEDFTAFSFARYMFLMRRKGFSLRFLGGQRRKYFQCCWSRRNIQIDLCFYFLHGDQRVFAMWGELDQNHVFEYSIPARLLEVLSPIDFYGETVMVPKYKEAVVTHEYGDWQVPRPDWNSKAAPSLSTRRPRTFYEKWQSRLLYYSLRKIWNVTEVLGRSVK